MTAGTDRGLPGIRCSPRRVQGRAVLLAALRRNAMPNTVAARPTVTSVGTVELPVRGSSAGITIGSAGAVRVTPRTVGTNVVGVTAASVVVVVDVVEVEDVVVVGSNTLTNTTVAGPTSPDSLITTVPSSGVTEVEVAPPSSVSVTTHSAPVQMPSNSFELPASRVNVRSKPSSQVTWNPNVAEVSPETVFATIRWPWGPMSPPSAAASVGTRPTTAMTVPAMMADVPNRRLGILVLIMALLFIGWTSI